MVLLLVLLHSRLTSLFCCQNLLSFFDNNKSSERPSLSSARVNYVGEVEEWAVMYVLRTDTEYLYRCGAKTSR